MSDDDTRNDLKHKTAETARTYFEGYPWDKPYELWCCFDEELAKDLSMFITGKMYARQKLSHPTRQLVAIAALTALGRDVELRLHIWAGFNVGLTLEEMAETIFQIGVYAGMPQVNRALCVLKEAHEAWEARSVK
jgi:4-carboxymuconolactone decarboxylase